ncbi:uncharacterized protein LOC135316285 [Phalacrocorax carbo]|uniref:uncharacterized protein LOC135316285 n=1 Tax=Phalacrocorax carbo TaxID=9209 RepID=UPI00311A6CF4
MPAGCCRLCPKVSPHAAGVPEDTGTSIPSVMATILRALLGPTVGQLFLNSMERMLDTSWQWLNRYLPLGERQWTGLQRSQIWPHLLSTAASFPSAPSLATPGAEPWPWCSSSGRSGWTHPHLQHILNVMKTVQQGLEELLCNSQAMWAHRNQAQAAPCPHSACPSTQVRPVEGCRTPMLPAGRVLAVRQMLAQRLQDTLVPLWAWVAQLPALLQQAAW